MARTHGTGPKCNRGMTMQKSESKTTLRSVNDSDFKVYQQDNLKKWIQDAIKCPMRGLAETVKPFCKVGGYRHGGFMDCEYETCFARFAKHISG
jgi:hypothetical protein